MKKQTLILTLLTWGLFSISYGQKAKDFFVFDSKYRKANYISEKRSSNDTKIQKNFILNQ